jgi:hypothetical protein
LELYTFAVSLQVDCATRSKGSETALTDRDIPVLVLEKKIRNGTRTKTMIVEILIKDSIPNKRSIVLDSWLFGKE